MLDEDTVTIFDDIHHRIVGISKISSHAAFLMANYSYMHRADFLAGAISDEVLLRQD
jgi:hypothetical protein